MLAAVEIEQHRQDRGRSVPSWPVVTSVAGKLATSLARISAGLFNDELAVTWLDTCGHRSRVSACDGLGDDASPAFEGATRLADSHPNACENVQLVIGGQSAPSRPTTEPTTRDECSRGVSPARRPSSPGPSAASDRTYASLAVRGVGRRAGNRNRGNVGSDGMTIGSDSDARTRRPFPSLTVGRDRNIATMRSRRNAPTITKAIKQPGQIGRRTGRRLEQRRRSAADRRRHVDEGSALRAVAAGQRSGRATRIPECS